MHAFGLGLMLKESSLGRSFDLTTKRMKSGRSQGSNKSKIKP